MKNLRLIFSLLLVCGWALGVNSQQVLQWRGADRSGLYPETNLLNSWPETGPALLW